MNKFIRFSSEEEWHMKMAELAATAIVVWVLVVPAAIYTWVVS